MTSYLCGVSLGVFSAWIVGIITIILALIYPLVTRSEEEEE
jgi:hypothetical protein